MNYLLIDQDNPNKAHHIKFKNGSVFYNQAIKADNLPSSKVALKNTFKAKGANWYDFYQDEQVLDGEFHGYRVYINKAKELHKESEDLSRVPFTLSELKNLVSQARDNAKEIAQGHYSFIRSRGASISVYDEHQEKITEEGEIEFKSLKSLKEAISQNPNLSSLSISGGFDGAETMQDLNDGFLETWLSEWSVDLFENGRWLREPRVFSM